MRPRTAAAQQVIPPTESATATAPEIKLPGQQTPPPQNTNLVSSVQGILSGTGNWSDLGRDDLATVSKAAAFAYRYAAAKAKGANFTASAPDGTRKTYANAADYARDFGYDPDLLDALGSVSRVPATRLMGMPPLSAGKYEDMSQGQWSEWMGMSAVGQAITDPSFPRWSWEGTGKGNVVTAVNTSVYELGNSEGSGYKNAGKFKPAFTEWANSNAGKPITIAGKTYILADNPIVYDHPVGTVTRTNKDEETYDFSWYADGLSAIDPDTGFPVVLTFGLYGSGWGKDGEKGKYAINKSGLVEWPVTGA
jgi:hypothetical protein